MASPFQAPFRAYQGFLELIPPREIGQRFSTFVDEAIRDLQRLAPDAQSDRDSLVFERGGSRGYSAMRLIDTFLDFECIQLEKILESSRNAGISGGKERGLAAPVQLLLMSPFSQIAAIRYSALIAADPGRWQASDPVEYVTHKLHEVVGLLARVIDEPRPPCPDPRPLNFNDQLEACEALVTIVSEMGSRAGFELRFYDQFTDAPLYVLGKFILKGIILDRYSATHNPWLAFVDDPNQPADLYDSAVRRVDALWANAHRRPTQYGFPLLNEDRPIRAFIAMPMGRDRADEWTARKEAIQRACERFDEGARKVDALRADDIPTINRPLDDVLVERIRQSDLLIADLSENRPNVYYEAGLAQAMNKPVVFVVDRATRDSVEFDLRNYRLYDFESIEELEKAIRTGVRSVFEKLSLFREPAQEED